MEIRLLPVEFIVSVELYFICVIDVGIVGTIITVYSSGIHIIDRYLRKIRIPYPQYDILLLHWDGRHRE